jgi:dTDP-4-amino-4,6-dideoxygalactose transaminase
MSKIIPVSNIDLGPQETEAVNKILASNWLTMGDITSKFEKEFAQYIGVKHAIAVTNGTAALHLALKGLGIAGSDEVIVPSLTFVATANAILYVGAQPVFADVTDLSDWNISPADIERKITSRTKAIIVMHYAGYSCNMNAIKSLARKHSLFVVEDAAHSPGAEYNGGKCGSLGDIGCFSFFSNKNMTTGEGGMITTDNDDLAKKIKLLRSHGMTSVTLDRHKGHAYSYDVVELGYNYRIDEIRASIGLVQLSHLTENNNKREQVFRCYQERLKKIKGLSLPFLGYKDRSVHHIFPVLLEENIDRREFMEILRLNGIQTSIHYPPVHLFAFYRHKFNTKAGELLLTEDIACREVTLPMYPALIEDDVEYIVANIHSILEQSRM